MPDLETRPLFQIADKVRVKCGVPPLVGLVAEVSGARSRDGGLLYRVRVPMDPEPLWLLLREDEMENA
jgi:hypothetical protein